MSFEEKLANNAKTNPKSFYNYTRSKLKSKDSVGPLVFNDTVLARDVDIA